MAVDHQRSATISQIGEVIAAILGFNVDTLVKNPSYRGMHFVDAGDDVVRVQAVAAELKRGARFGILSLGQLKELAQCLVAALQALQGMASFTPEVTNEPTSPRREKIVSDLRSSVDKLATTAVPYLAYLALNDKTAWEAAKAEIDRDLANLRHSSDEQSNRANAGLQRISVAAQSAEAALDQIRATSAAVGVKAYATTFGSEAADHKDASVWWLAGAIVTALGGIAIVLYVLTTHEIPADAGSGKIAQYVLLRLVLIVLVYFVPLWCSRNYRAERHLQVVNRHRVNALVTFETFVSATKDESTRNAVLLEATRCIFAQTQTGYLGGDESLPADRVLEVVKTATGRHE
jgi:hypothetical protein